MQQPCGARLRSCFNSINAQFSSKLEKIDYHDHDESKSSEYRKLFGSRTYKEDDYSIEMVRKFKDKAMATR